MYPDDAGVIYDAGPPPAANPGTAVEEPAPPPPPPLPPPPPPQPVAPVARACSTSLSAWPTTLRVTVRTDFTTTLDDSFWHAADSDYHVRPDGRAVGKATVEFVGTSISGKTDAQGVVDLDTSPLADGANTLRITAENVSDDPVGPLIADPLADPLPERIYRTLEIKVTTLCGAIQTAAIVPRKLSDGSTTVTHGKLGNTKLRKWDAVSSPTHLPIDLKPIWMRTRAESGRPAADPTPTMIIIHHTGAPIGTDLNTWLPTGSVVSTHYVIDLDGHIIKLVKDSRQSWHADPAKWGGRRWVNNFSVGIELINDDGQNYTESQYTAVIGLVRRLQAAYPIPMHRVAAHSDIAVGDSVMVDGKAQWIHLDRHGRKLSDPGSRFEWERLERLGYGLIAAPGPSLVGYGGVFDTPVELRSGDRDRGVGVTPLYGGAKRTDIQDDVIKQLQNDLTGIGYSVNINGKYDEETMRAVMVFQEHYFSGSRRTIAHTRGSVNETTAEAISLIRGAMP
jgi:N-acetylmuramoyl-L-alanine amidase